MTPELTREQLKVLGATNTPGRRPIHHQGYRKRLAYMEENENGRLLFFPQYPELLNLCVHLDVDGKNEQIGE
ncbi:MAG: hypothetical protein D4R44_08090 [Actinobacteria bacterium]|nr:MAG: hypothetical protein D4R44_08090 [Actinomycetota bacterium]